MSFATASSLCCYGHRDERRRRLLTDDLSGSDGQRECRARPGDAAPALNPGRYGNAEFLRHSPRLFDLIPRRWLALLGGWVAAVAIVAGLDVAYVWMHRCATFGGRPKIAALDIAAQGGIASWFSSLVLLAAGAMAIMVYAVRRHRTDDYQGRYRIWLWAAGCWFFLAADRAAGLGEAVRDVAVALTGISWLGDGVLWWAVAYALLLGSLGSRLWLDMRSNRPALATFAMAAAAYGSTIAIRLGWFWDIGAGSNAAVNPQEVLVRVGCATAGDLLLLTAMTLQARHVLLDAEGLLPCSRQDLEDARSIAMGKAIGDAAEGPKKAFFGKIDPPHVLPQASHPPVVRAAAPAVPPPPSATVSAVSPAPIHRKLTKAERRALKDRLLREREERQRRG